MRVGEVAVDFGAVSENHCLCDVSISIRIGYSDSLSVASHMKSGSRSLRPGSLGLVMTPSGYAA